MSQLKINKSNDWSGKKGNKSVVGVYDISLLKDGEEVQLNCRFRIEKTLDKKYLSSKDFSVLQAVGDDYQEIEYKLEDGKLIFYVDSLCQFVVLAKTPQYWRWYVAAAVLVAVAIAAAVTATYIFSKKKKAKLNCQRAEETVRRTSVVCPPRSRLKCLLCSTGWNALAGKASWRRCAIKTYQSKKK